MAKDSASASVSVTADLQRKDLYYIAPERLTITTDKDAVLYDERAESPPAERMVRSVFVNGVIEPVIVRKNGGLIEVIDGRKRTMAAIEANKRLAAEGADPLQIPIVFKRGDVGELASMVIFLNEIREDDSILVKAKKAQRLLDRGRTEEQVAEAFGLESTATVANWLKLLECSPKIQRLVDDGRLRLADAKKIAELPEDEQATAAEKIMVEAPTRKERKARGESPKKRAANPQTRLRKFQKYAVGADGIKDVLAKKANSHALLMWILGELPGTTLAEECPELAALVAAKAKKSRAPKKAA